MWLCLLPYSIHRAGMYSCIFDRSGGDYYRNSYIALRWIDGYRMDVWMDTDRWIDRYRMDYMD